MSLSDTPVVESCPSALDSKPTAALIVAFARLVRRVLRSTRSVSRLAIGAARDLTRTRSELLAENALLRQGKLTAYGHRFTTNRVGSLRRHWNIPRFDPDVAPPPAEGELVNIREAAKRLGIAPSTIHRWINDRFIPGEQITPGAPWRIRLTEELLARFVEQSPEGYVPMVEATKKLGVSRQTVLQRVKRGELDAVHVYRGRRKGLRIRVIDEHPDLSQPPA